MNRNWTKGLNNLELTDNSILKLEEYYKLLLEWNSKMNLTTITEQTEVYYKHFYDALLITENVVLENQNIIDVGSGAGIPGLVLKICFPNLQLTIVESNSKKCQFLQTVVNILNLENVHVVNERAEILAHQFREMYDIVIARAVASLNILNELCLALVKINGIFIAYKGLKVLEEIKLSQNSFKLLGAKIINQFEFDLPNNYGHRVLLNIQKYALTPLKYPREYKQIISKPL